MRETRWEVDDERFGALALDSFGFQFEHCLPYRRFCEARGATPDSVGDWREVPAAPAGAFKEIALRSFPAELTHHTFRTSGTAGLQRGELHLDTLSLYEASLLPPIRRFLFPDLADGERCRIIVMTPSPEEAPDSSLSHMFGCMLEALGTKDSCFCLKPIRLLEAATEPLALCGTALAFAHLLDSASRLQLPTGSRVMETGGFKGHERKLSRDELYASIGEKLGIPAITTQMGKGVVDETGPHFLGNTALSDGDFVHRAIGAADLIINVGHDVVEKPPFFMQPGGATVVHVNFNSAQVDPVYFPQIELVGDIANSLWQLKERLEPQEHWSFADFHRVRDALQAHIAEGERDDRFPILPPRLVREIRKVMPDDGTIALDNGMYKIWFARNYPATHPNTVLLDNALASMGAGLPSAMAAKMVHPDRRVMAVCGDGGFMMNSQELETAVRLRLDLVVLILRDDGYGMIKWKQKQMDFHDFGLDFQNPDFVAYAKSYGAQGHRVESTEGLGPLVEECYAAGGVHVIDLQVDYSDNDRVLNQEIRELSRKV